MSFTPSNEPNKWQGLYTEKQAHIDSLGKIGSLLIPILLVIVLPILYLIFHVGHTLEILPQKLASWFIVPGIILILAPFTYSFIGLRYLFNIAEIFLGKFHNLPATGNIARIVRLRVMRIPLLPPPLSGMFKFPEITVKDGKLDPAGHWSTIVGGPVRLKIESGHALYLEYGGKFSRVVGQGKAFLEFNERIAAAVNVGPRSENILVTAWTKDGIKIKVHARGEYFLGRERQEEEENILIPFDPESIRKAVEYTLKSGKEANEWLKSATGQTQGILGGYIAEKYLDELFLRENNDITLLSTENMRNLLGKVNSRLQEYGVCLSNLQITEVVLPPIVKHQRLETWETEHESIALISKGEAKAHQIRMRELAHAETQQELIVTIANSLQRIDATNFPEPLLLSLSGFLDQSMNDPKVRAGVTKESLETLEKIQEMLRFPLWLPGEAWDNEG